MSGESNVVFWLEQRGIDPHPDLVGAIIERAKQGNHLLDEAEIYGVVNERSVKTGS
jgi:diketogulonate reductase-like aldo/keto reductase